MVICWKLKRPKIPKSGLWGITDTVSVKYHPKASSAPWDFGVFFSTAFFVSQDGISGKNLFNSKLFNRKNLIQMFWLLKKPKHFANPKFVFEKFWFKKLSICFLLGFKNFRSKMADMFFYPKFFSLLNFGLKRFCVTTWVKKFWVTKLGWLNPEFRTKNFGPS